jgi:choline dehydrogenase-like flavoprotein
LPPSSPRAGFDVVVLEQGPWRTARDFDHDEVGHWILGSLTGSARGPPDLPKRSSEEAQVSLGAAPLIYARGVGGSSVHFTANYWRLRPGRLPGAVPLGPDRGNRVRRLALTYDELEPYYTRAEWEWASRASRVPSILPAHAATPCPRSR